MQEVKYYEIYDWDGGDRHMPSGIGFSTKEEADLYVKKCKSQTLVQKKEVAIVDSIHDVPLARLAKAKENALKKLTPKERELLGFPSD